MATRWACLGPGKVSECFFRAISENLPAEDHEFVAVASRDLQRAQSFAEKFKFKKAYGSYDEVTKDEDVEIVYIATLNTSHVELSIKMLEAGKHVLCEKPMAMNLKQAKQVLTLAKAKNLLFVEGSWSRFFPAYDQIRKDLHLVGDVQVVQATFNVPIKDIERLKELSLGGGVTLDIGFYTVQLACLVFQEIPVSITAQGIKQHTGADLGACVILKYKSGGMAVLTYHADVPICDNQACIYGNSGTIKISPPFYCPEEVTTPSGQYAFPLKQGNYDFVNSAGLCYEAAAVREYLLAGKVDNDKYSHADAELVHSILDEIRRQLGVVYPDFD